MKKPAPPSASTEKAWETLIASLGAGGGSAGSMFGMPCLKARTGKAVAGLFGDAIVFKLAPPEHASAKALAGAALFDPSGMGRPMKEWIVVPAAHAKLWQRFGVAAMEAGEANGAPAKAKTPPQGPTPTKAKGAASAKRR